MVGPYGREARPHGTVPTTDVRALAAPTTALPQRQTDCLAVLLKIGHEGV
ncbi:MAG: hypothetical protein JO115_08510 [Pseudonocardiales bacterium]|nr:hypothetical protein [Pseudonocardiales bacterium]